MIILGILQLTLQFAAVKEVVKWRVALLMHSCQPSRNFGPCPGDVGDVPDLHAPCASFRRLPLAYGSSSDLKRAV